MPDAAPAPIQLSSGPLKRIGGAIAVDFVNTVDWHLRDDPEERLLSYADLLAWTEGVGGIDQARARRLARLAKAEPAAAVRVLDEARRLRAALFQVLLAVGGNAVWPPDDLDVVNRWLARVPRTKLERHRDKLSWRWPEPETVETVLVPILWSAGDLLAGEASGQLKLCAAPGCGWLFLDASRRASRVWCSMESCGNRAKAQRHYRRTRSG